METSETIPARAPKAADIPDAFIFSVIDQIRKDKGRWTWVSDICDALESAGMEFPFKVVQAKVYQMVNKKRVQGCGCGCRGDLMRLEER